MFYTTLSNGTSFTNARNVIIRIDTNQGNYGLGELRDGALPLPPLWTITEKSNSRDEPS